ncbi:hypothetical protein, partial [Clostridium sp.]
IQENKIRVTSGGAYSELETEEDIFRLSNYYFSGDPIKINIGDEVYLFHAIDGDILTTESLGLLSKEELDRLIEKNEVNIFIKLVCEEIKK